MASSTIPVDLRNPGQVFACLGLMEAAEILLEQPCEGGFDYRDLDIETTFTLRMEGADDPIAAVVRFLARAEVKALAPQGSKLSTAKWDIETSAADAGDKHAFPCPVPDSPAALPILLSDGRHRILVDHWADGPETGRDNVKFWAGAAGYPGAALARDALATVGALGDNAIRDAIADPFNVSAPQSSSFRFDWRRDYVPLDAGFSPNVHGDVRMVGYPLVEMLAAIGLQNARPHRPEPRDKLAYRYGVSNLRLPTVFVRVILGAQPLWQHPFQRFPIRIFRMRLGWPGQEGQARCIIDAQEEFEP
ncbi:MAG TPA: type I-U CRISPR-associated protein Cas8c [Xanthobacteraceae bacterium]|nr:type I-U CRISPR-associated protein Cas8c [Xanthobacteraceae bacterium]